MLSMVFMPSAYERVRTRTSRILTDLPAPVSERDRGQPPGRLDLMPEPKAASFPKIRGALKFYQIASIVTGVMLLLLLAEMILKYGPTHLELFAGGSGGFLWFATVIVGDDCQWYSLFVPGGMGCELESTGQTA